MSRVQAYRDAGVKLVWVVVPPDRTLDLFHSNQPAKIHSEKDALGRDSISFPASSAPSVNQLNDSTPHRRSAYRVSQYERPMPDTVDVGVAVGAGVGVGPDPGSNRFSSQ